jgi:hypothetical protein
MEILDLQSLETPADEAHADASTLSVVNCGVSTVSTVICL